MGLNPSFLVFIIQPDFARLGISFSALILQCPFNITEIHLYRMYSMNNICFLSIKGIYTEICNVSRQHSPGINIKKGKGMNFGLRANQKAVCIWSNSDCSLLVIECGISNMV